MSYLPALDGLRALAVVAVVVYHAGLAVAGGYLGVEVFFVLSGFLITALLYAEWHAHGRVDLGAFWLRRARRLLPALGLVIAGTLAFVVLVLPEELSDVVHYAMAALLYAVNWQLIASGQSYFDPIERPPLLQHLWSLAVEEQFYLLWPPLFVAGMRLLRRRGLLVAVLAGAAGSVAAMAAMHEPGVDPTRLYYGTDTRASALLLGAALALVWVPGALPGAQSRAVGRTLSAGGALALVGILAGFLVLDSRHPWLYQGGFVGISLLTLLVIMAATHPQATWLTAPLSWKPLRWIGVRSYSIYLWHWPVLNVTRPELDVMLDGWPLLVVRVAIVIALADLSYRCLEVPVRQGAFSNLWQCLLAWRPIAQWHPALAMNTAGVPGAHTIVQRGSSGHAAHGSRRRWSKSAVRRRLPNVRLARLRSNAADHGAAPPTPRALRWSNVLMCSVLLISTATCASTGSMPLIPTRHPGGPTTLAPEPTLERVHTPAGVAENETLTPPLATQTATAQPAHTSVPTAESVGQLPPIDAALAARLQQVLDQTVADGHIPGASLAVSIPGNATWTGTSGIASREDGRPLAPETGMRIASISKMFTAVVVLQLVEEGKLSLDDRLSAWLPESVPHADQITLRMLLQHTTGLYDYLEDSTFTAQAYAKPERAWKPDEMVAYAAKKHASFAPGAADRWDYSSTNYVLLGMIVEKVTGNSMAQEERWRIYEPLQLDATYFAPFEEAAGPQAHGYSKTRDQTAVAMSYAFATANVVSTPHDLARFGDALFGGQLLKPETIDEMLSFVNGKGSYNMPALEYGLGVMRNILPAGNAADGSQRPEEASTVLGHIGGFGGFRSAMWHAPGSGITIALGVNQASTDPNVLATRVWKVLLDWQGEE